MKFRNVFFLLLAIPTMAFGAQYTHTFGKVEPNPFSVRENAPDLLYSVEFINGQWRHGSGAFASELAPIAKYMGLSKPEDLSGKSFTSDISESFEALDQLRMKAIHNGKYVPPTPERFFEQLAKGLVASKDGSCPRTADIADNNTVWRAMSTAFKRDSVICSELDSNFLNNFNQRISRLSGGKMTVVIAESKEINGISFRCGGEYLFLKEGDKPIAKFTLAAASNGFACTKDSKALASRSRVTASPAHTSSGNGGAGVPGDAAR